MGGILNLIVLSLKMEIQRYPIQTIPMVKCAWVGSTIRVARVT